jgi:hypothetical protein
VWFNHNTTSVEKCSINAPEGACYMTQIGKFIGIKKKILFLKIGTFVNRLSIKTNFFGVIYFVLSWVFLLTFVIGTKKKRFFFPI